MYVYLTLHLYSSRVACAYDMYFFVLLVTIANVRTTALWIPVIDTLSLCLFQPLTTPFIRNFTLLTPFIRLNACIPILVLLFLIIYHGVSALPPPFLSVVTHQ